jgi:Fe2+ or Zn2+ uptake regulation protein
MSISLNLFKEFSMLSVSFNIGNCIYFCLLNIFNNSVRTFGAIFFASILTACGVDTTAPIITSGVTATPIYENSGAGQVVYIVTSNDSAATYTLSGIDSESFTIDGSSGEVTLIPNPDFEIQSSYTFIVTATDIDTNSSSITVTLLINIPSNLIITSGTTATAINEKSGAGQIVYTVTSNDSAATYTLSGTDSASFTIDNNTGEVTLIPNPDFEIQSSYSFIVTATNKENESASVTTTLSINDVRAPIITSGSAAAPIYENSGAIQIVYTVTSNDSTATYSLSGNDEVSFIIDSNTGKVTLINNPDYETKSSYSFIVTATNTANESSSVAVTLSINDILAPIITSGSTALPIDESSGAGQVIYTITSNDSAVKYTLSETDSASFTINSSTGEVTLINDPDFEIQSSYNFTVTVTNTVNESSSIMVTLPINDVRAPIITSGSTAIPINDNSGAGQVVYTVTSNDSTATYTLSGTDNASFTINSSTGEVTLTNNPNQVTQSSYIFTVTATNLAGESSFVIVSLSIDNSTAPTVTSGSTALPIDESSGAGQVIYTVTSNDNAATYTLSGTDSASFTINNNTGKVILINDPDFETKGSYSFIVTATNLANESSSITVTLSINNVRAPIITSGATALPIDENSGSGQVIYTVTSNESAATYTLSGTDSILFTINSNTGEVTLINDPDFEIQSSYSFTVTATNTITESSSIVIALSVNDLSAPIITSGPIATPINESSGAGQVIYTVTSNDNAATYTLSGTDSASFTINSSTGETILINDPDYETQSSYSFTVTAINATNESSSVTATLYIKNISVPSANLTTITAATDGTKNLTLIWDSVATESNQSVTYSVCEKDIAQSNDCKILTSVTDQLTAEITVDTLVSAMLTDYFILASSIGELSISSENNLSSNEVAKMVNYFKPSNTGSSDKFGQSVAISGDGNILAIGSPYEDNSASGIFTDGSETTDIGTATDSGAVYLFTKVNGSWQQTAYVKASNTNAGDLFGYQVSLSDDGTILAVSAFSEDSTALNSGAIYIFSNDGTTWVQTALLKASNVETGDEFGFAIALSGDGTTLAVGAPKEDNGVEGVIIDGSEVTDANTATDSGAVYLFTNDSVSWEQVAYLKVANNAYSASDALGYSVALNYDGTTLAAGAPLESTNSTSITFDGLEATNPFVGFSGAAYLFNYIGGAWTQKAFVKSSVNAAASYFGISISLSHDGHTLVVGSPSYYVPEFKSGNVSIFSDSNGNWESVVNLWSSNPELQDRFGTSIALSGDGNALAVGAVGEDNSAIGIIVDGSEVNDISTLSDAGAVYLLSNESGDWKQTAYIKASNTGTTDLFSTSLALSKDGSTLAVGAPDEDNSQVGIIVDGTETTDVSTAANSGAVYIY